MRFEDLVDKRGYAVEQPYVNAEGDKDEPKFEMFEELEGALSERYSGHVGRGAWGGRRPGRDEK